MSEAQYMVQKPFGNILDIISRCCHYVSLCAMQDFAWHVYYVMSALVHVRFSRVTRLREIKYSS